jgi:hypothetical protein
MTWIYGSGLIHYEYSDANTAEDRAATSGCPTDVDSRRSCTTCWFTLLAKFFAPHQDPEKTDDMIGTLVVSLPSRFTGGTMSTTR